MVTSATDSRTLLIALGAALAALAVAALAEHWHARRTARVARLAFGESGRPATWAMLAPVLRIAGLALVAFGATVLLRHDPVEQLVEPNPRASRQLLVVLDVSPSMNLTDAGPGTEKLMRGVWAGRVLRGILDRLDMQDTRVSMIAFYSRAVPMLEDSTDKEVLANLMDGLPLYTAFKPGETDMQAGLDAAFEMAKGWARKSTTLVVISDGDLSKPVTPRPRPASIADVIVIGVGDPNRPTIVNGHASRQDSWTLKSVAGKLDGYYHQGNTRHLPREVLDRLTMIAPRVGAGLGLREAGLLALGLGAAITGLLGPLLLLFGTPRARPARATESDGGRAGASAATSTTTFPATFPTTSTTASPTTARSDPTTQGRLA
jgi:Ca-activated chloride channel family protein